MLILFNTDPHLGINLVEFHGIGQFGSQDTWAGKELLANRYLELLSTHRAEYLKECWHGGSVRSDGWGL